MRVCIIVRARDDCTELYRGRGKCCFINFEMIKQAGRDFLGANPQQCSF